MNNSDKTIDLIEWLINESGATPYRIGKEAGVSVTVIDRIAKEGRPIDKLAIATAAKLERYARKLKEEKRMEKLQLEGLDKAIEEFNDWPRAAALYWNRDRGYVDVDVYHNDVEATQTAFVSGIIVLYRKNERAGDNKNIGPKRKAFILDFVELMVDGYDAMQAEYQLMDKYPASYFG